MKRRGKKSMKRMEEKDGDDKGTEAEQSENVCQSAYNNEQELDIQSRVGESLVFISICMLTFNTLLYPVELFK
jgi:hypothetical protein